MLRNDLVVFLEGVGWFFFCVVVPGGTTEHAGHTEKHGLCDIMK